MTETKNLQLAKEIKKFLEKNNIHQDTRIYFNGMAWCFDSYGNYSKMENTYAHTYVNYYNEEGITMTFEGNLYHVFNYTHEKSNKLVKKWNELLDKYGCYSEFGYAWSLAIYE